METTPNEPNGRELAPGRLLLVQELINSRDVDAGTDELSDPEAFAAWLSARELIGPGDRLGLDDLERARVFREGLRALLEQRAHGGIQDATVRALNASADGAVLRARLDAEGSPVLEPAASGLDRVLAELLAIIARADLDGTWARLKVCAERTCSWAFYDRSKNRSGNWCSMAVCGNRAKARNYRARHAAHEG